MPGSPIVTVGRAVSPRSKHRVRRGRHVGRRASASRVARPRARTGAAGCPAQARGQACAGALVVGRPRPAPAAKRCPQRECQRSADDRRSAGAADPACPAREARLRRATRAAGGDHGHPAAGHPGRPGRRRHRLGEGHAGCHRREPGAACHRMARPRLPAIRCMAAVDRIDAAVRADTGLWSPRSAGGHHRSGDTVGSARHPTWTSATIVTAMRAEQHPQQAEVGEGHTDVGFSRACP